MQDRVLQALAILAGFLLVVSLTAQLVPTGGSSHGDPGDGPVGTSAEQAPVSAYLEAVHQRTDLRPVREGTDEDRLVCTPVRTLKTTFRPVLLVERNETGCGTVEAMALALHLEGRHGDRLIEAQMAVCRVPDYRMSLLPHGEMISRPNVTACQDAWTHIGHDGQAASARISEDQFDGPGLRLACAAGLVETGDGQRLVIQDLTWFEVWKLEDPPDRQAYRQSQDIDQDCQDLDAPWKPKLG